MERKRGRKPRSDGEATRAALVEAAAAEFAEKGYALASTRGICTRAGVNIALANRYFGSKESLYRTVAKSLFGDLGAPLAELADGVDGELKWRAAIVTWVDDMLFMTLSTKKAQTQCAALFRHEVTHPTRFHGEFERDFGKPVFDSLRRLLAMATEDAEELALWTSSIWAEVSVYALADRTWHAAFRPKGVAVRAWAERVRDHICASLFAALRYRGKGN